MKYSSRIMPKKIRVINYYTERPDYIRAINKRNSHLNRIKTLKKNFLKCTDEIEKDYILECIEFSEEMAKSAELEIDQARLKYGITKRVKQIKIKHLKQFYQIIPQQAVYSLENLLICNE